MVLAQICRKCTLNKKVQTRNLIDVVQECIFDNPSLLVRFLTLKLHMNMPTILHVKPVEPSKSRVGSDEGAVI